MAAFPAGVDDGHTTRRISSSGFNKSQSLAVFLVVTAGLGGGILGERSVKSCRKCGSIFVRQGTDSQNGCCCALSAVEHDDLAHRPATRPRDAGKQLHPPRPAAEHFPDERHILEMSADRTPNCQTNFFRRAVELQAAINRFLAEHNQEPRHSAGPRAPTKIIAASFRAGVLEHFCECGADPWV